MLDKVGKVVTLIAKLTGPRTNYKTRAWHVYEGVSVRKIRIYPTPSMWEAAAQRLVSWTG